MIDYRSVITIVFLHGLLISGALPTRAAEPADPTIAKAGNGAWEVKAESYTASVNAQGYLSSLKVGKVEAMGAPLGYQPEAGLVADTIELTDGVLHVALKAKNQEATIDYKFRADGFTITPRWKGKEFSSCSFTASPLLLGIELLNDKRAMGAEQLGFEEHGEIRGVPAVSSSGNQMVRFHFHTFSILAYVQRWGCQLNYASAGTILDHSWKRELLDADTPIPFVFLVESDQQNPGPTSRPSTSKPSTTKPAKPAKLAIVKPATFPAVPFIPRAPMVAALYYTDEPLLWQIELPDKKAVQLLMQLGVRALKLSWSITDIHDLEVGKGSGALTQQVQLKNPGSGYFQVLFTISDPAGKMLASSFRTRFTVIHKIHGMLGRDDSLQGKGISDYAVVGMIGVGAIREAHYVKEYFSDSQPTDPQNWQKVEGTDIPVWMNTKGLDEMMNGAAAQSAHFGVNWFLMLNERPEYATPPVYEAMAYAIVSHYKSACHVWEVENEPNARYSPQDYLNKCLAPFARGAKRADPKCTVMGPTCVGLKETLSFVDYINKSDGAKYLDSVSTHSYPGPGESWEQFGNVSMFQELRKLVGPDKQIWQTEEGYWWDNGPRSQAARYASRQFLQGYRLGIDPAHQYYFYPQSHGFISMFQAGGGEKGAENSWLPVAAAQHFLAENTFGLKYAGDIPSPYKGIYLSRFLGGKTATEDVIAAWTFDFNFKLSVKIAKLKRVVGYMGADLPIKGGVDQSLELSLSGEPIYIHIAKGTAFDVTEPSFGVNLALAEAGSIASASSESGGHPASMANDDRWEQFQGDVPGLPGRTFWQSGQTDPSPESPDWLEIKFSEPKKINRIVAICYLPAISASPRDWELQAEVDGKWQSISSAKDDWTWCIHATFPPITATRVRLTVTKINDGWHADRKWMHVVMGSDATHFTDSKLQITELEIYGPAAP